MDHLARLAETSEKARDTEAHFQIVSITEIDTEDELAAGELDALLASEKTVSTLGRNCGAMQLTSMLEARRL